MVIPTGGFVAATFWVREVSGDPLVQTALLVGVLFGSYGVMRWGTELRGWRRDR